jgi:putative ABC transport system ATP-binding protein
MPRIARYLLRSSLFRAILGGKRKPTRRGDQPAIRSDAPTVLKSEATLRGIDLFRTFGAGECKTTAVQNVSLELRPNELNLLMGPSGSGKTTLLALVSALLRPCGGRVQALGQDVWNMSEQDLERFRLRHCSYVFQGYNLFPALTAREQLEIVLKWGEGVGAREARRRSEAVLGQLGLGNKLHLRPAQMSGGEKQRVAIGRALVKNPSFLFADEPTSALDWENGQQVIELLHGVARQRGATVLVVTHDPRLLPHADRVFEMADGQLAAEPAADVLTLAHSHAPTHPHHPAPVLLPFPARTAMGGKANGHRSPAAIGPRLTLKDPAFAGS